MTRPINYLIEVLGLWRWKSCVSGEFCCLQPGEHFQVTTFTPVTFCGDTDHLPQTLWVKEVPPGWSHLQTLPWAQSHTAGCPRSPSKGLSHTPPCGELPAPRGGWEAAGGAGSWLTLCWAGALVTVALPPGAGTSSAWGQPPGGGGWGEEGGGGPGRHLQRCNQDTGNDGTPRTWSWCLVYE